MERSSTKDTIRRYIRLHRHYMYRDVFGLFMGFVRNKNNIEEKKKTDLSFKNCILERYCSESCSPLYDLMLCSATVQCKQGSIYDITLAKCESFWIYTLILNGTQENK